MQETLFGQARPKPPGEVLMFFQTLAGIAVLALVMAGVGGTVYKLLAPEGWIAQAFGLGMSIGAAGLLAFLCMAVFAYLTRSWLSPRRRNRLAELWVYTFAGGGLVYFAQFWLTGAL